MFLQKRHDVAHTDDEMTFMKISDTTVKINDSVEFLYLKILIFKNMRFLRYRIFS